MALLVVCEIIVEEVEERVKLLLSSEEEIPSRDSDREIRLLESDPLLSFILVLWVELKMCGSITGASLLIMVGRSTTDAELFEVTWATEFVGGTSGITRPLNLVMHFLLCSIILLAAKLAGLLCNEDGERFILTPLLIAEDVVYLVAAELVPF